MKGGEVELAAEVAQQLQQEAFPLERPVQHTMLELYLKLGRWEDALSVLADMKAQVRGGGGACRLSRCRGSTPTWCAGGAGGLVDPGKPR